MHGELVARAIAGISCVLPPSINSCSVAIFRVGA